MALTPGLLHAQRTTRISEDFSYIVVVIDAGLDRTSQFGICGYCDSRITTGEFDWVLAFITQNEFHPE